MRKTALSTLGLAACVTLSGCLDWQGSYSAAARDECREIISTDERLACLRNVAENDTARRAERRQQSDSERQN